VATDKSGYILATMHMRSVSLFNGKCLDTDVQSVPASRMERPGLMSATHFRSNDCGLTRARVRAVRAPSEDALQEERRDEDIAEHNGKKRCLIQNNMATLWSSSQASLCFKEEHDKHAFQQSAKRCYESYDIFCKSATGIALNRFIQGVHQICVQHHREESCKEFC